MNTEMHAHKGKKEKTFKNHLEIVLHYICQLDIEAVDMVLDSKVTYMEFSKEKFIRLLGNAFEEFKAEGDTVLRMIPGNCVGCKINECNLTGYTLVGTRSLNYMNLLFEVKEEMVSDIYECYKFKNVIEIENLREQIYIKEFNDGEVPGNVSPF